MLKTSIFVIVIMFLGVSVGRAQVPTLVNATSGLNSLSSAGGGKEGSGCATNSYCTHLADPSLAGNTIIVFTTFSDSSGSSVTVSDDKSNVYTAGPAAHDTVHGRWVASFYSRNATVGTYNVTLTWPSGVAYMSAMVQQWMSGRSTRVREARLRMGQRRCQPVA